jgi:hypothetical protein
MPIDPRKRQRKLERRKAKQKAERRELVRRESRGLAAQFEEASAAPILHSCVGATIWQAGIGHVLVSRQLGDGRIAFAAFLVDVYCLGVKDAFANIAPRPRYERDLYDKLGRRDPLRPLKPECARKLVEGAVAYARDLGFPPHPDYRLARLLFGDICAEACSERYVFGKDGKPLFCAGPYDGAARCQEILDTLHARLGPKGYHFIVPAGGPLPF